MKKKILIIISAIVVLGLSTLSFAFYLRGNRLKLQSQESKAMIQKVQEEITRIQAEREKLSKEKEKLQVDAITYVDLNSQLQQDKERLQKRLEEAQKIIETKEGDLQREKSKLEQLEKKIDKEKTKEQKGFLKEKEELKNKITLLEETLKKERALYHYNLAVAYTQAKLYDEAVGAYEKSLKFNPDNPEAHYNLGLLYQNYKSDPDKAVTHYQRYLELKPEAEDKEEVKGWIESLK